jgi:hypothetical protein
MTPSAERPAGTAKIVALLSAGTLAVLGPAGYVGYKASIGGVWDHNRALEDCDIAVETNPVYRKAEIGVRDKWTWWLPGHSYTCVYDIPDGRTILKPPPQ